MDEDEIRNLLESFNAAWARGDHQAVADHFCEDGVYHASIGPEPGQSATGRTEITALVKAMGEKDDQSEATISHMLIHHETAAWKWIYRFPDGSVEVGCDFFKFRKGKILLKDAYRKVMEPSR